MTTEPTPSTKDKLDAVAQAEAEAQAKKDALLQSYQDGTETTGDPLEDWLLVMFQLKPTKHARKVMTDLRDKLKGKVGQFVAMLETASNYDDNHGIIGPRQHKHTTICVGVLREDALVLNDNKDAHGNYSTPFGFAVTGWMHTSEGGLWSADAFPYHDHRSDVSTPTVMRPDALPFYSWLGKGGGGFSRREISYGLEFLVGDEAVLDWLAKKHGRLVPHEVSRLYWMAKQIGRPIVEVPVLLEFGGEHRTKLKNELLKQVEIRDRHFHEIEFPTQGNKTDLAVLVRELREARRQIEEKILPHAKDFDLADDPLVQAEAARYKITL